MSDQPGEVPRKTQWILDYYPVGTKVQYCNPGRFGDGNRAEVSGHLHFTDKPERVSVLQLKWGGQKHSFVTVNQIRKYYKILPTKDNDETVN